MLSTQVTVSKGYLRTIVTVTKEPYSTFSNMVTINKGTLSTIIPVKVINL